MRSILQDIGYALRSFKKNPGFTGIIVLTLALGIGANAAVFTMIDVLVYRPFPIPNIENLVTIWGTLPEQGEDRDGVAPATFLDWRDEAVSFERLVASRWWDANITGETPERVQAVRVSPGFLSILDVTPIEGRLFREDEESMSANPVVVLSHRLWTRRYGSEAAIVGQTVILDGDPHQVVGVAEEGFDYPQGTELWAPLRFTSETAAVRNAAYLEVIGKLRAGASVERARAEMTAIAKRQEQAYPDTNQGRGIRVQELSQAVIDIGMPTLLALWQSTVLFVLLIACANIANLLLARGLDRQRELSLQQALGASRARIVRLLLTENLTLAWIGAIASIPFSWLALEALRSYLPAQIQRFLMGWDRISLNPRVLVFTALAAAATSIVFGLIPAWLASKPNLVNALNSGARGSTGSKARARGRSILVAAEIALALMLLVASGLTIQGAVTTIRADQGYDPDGVLTLEVMLPEDAYPEPTVQRQFFERALDEIRTLQSVESADVVNVIPAAYSGASRQYDTFDNPIVNQSERPSADYRVITPGLLETLKIPMRKGRVFNAADHDDTENVAIVSESMATSAWPNEDPIGKRFRFRGLEDEQTATVVGVSGDTIHNWFVGSRPSFYIPMSQHARRGMFFTIRTDREPESLVADVRERLLSVDPNQPIFNVRSLREQYLERTIGLRYMATVMSVFGLLALVLSAVGIYGLMSYSVSRRTQEIGIRMALGANRRDVLKLSLDQAIRLTVFGTGIGLPLAWLAGRLMENTVFGVIRLDWGTLIGLSLAIVAVSLLAGYLPARRAVTINPTLALRAD